jgi:ABC-type transport system substrate-binding protein
MQNRRFLALAALAAVTLSACGTSAPKAAPPTTPTTNAAPAPTTTAPPTTTATAAPTTTTTAAPTTTTSPTAAEEAAIRQSILGEDVARNLCFQDLTSCDPSTYSRGVYLAAEHDFMEKLISRKAIIRQQPDDPSYRIVRSITIGADGLTARALGCDWDTGLLLGSGGATVINDDKLTFESEWELLKDNGSWLVSSYTHRSFTLGENRCH